MSENVGTTQTPTPEKKQGNEQEPKRNRFDKKPGGKRLPKFVRVGIPLVLIAAIMIGVFSFVKSNTDKDGGEIVEATASIGTLSTYVTGWGSIAPKSKAEYGADLKGEVLEVAVESGDLVKTGDLLFTIDPSELKVDLLKAKEELSQLEKQLMDLGKNYENASRALSKAREALNNSDVRAPFAGIIISTPDILPKAGDSLATGTVLATIADNSNMRLTLYFNRAYIKDVSVGQTVAVSVPDSMSQINGTVSAVNDVSKPINGATCFSVEVKIPNSGGGLSENMDATGIISTPSGSVMPSEPGKLEYWQKEDIAFEGVTADIRSINIDNFAVLSQGQVICSVDSKPASDALNDAEYELQNYARQMSDDYIQNDIEKSKEKIAELEQICSTSAVYSTIDGQVSAVMIKPGDKLTQSGTAVLTVSDTSSLVINASIDETDISNVKVGMSVDITYDTSEGSASAFGTITYLGFEAQAASGDSGAAYAYFPATITLESDGSLLPGMNVNYSILAVTKDSCLMVPSQCIVNTEEGPVVYVKEGQDFDYEKVELGESTVPQGYYPVRVEVGLADATNTEIVSGIEEGTVLYQGTMSSDSGYWY